MAPRASTVVVRVSENRLRILPEVEITRILGPGHRIRIVRVYRTFLRNSAPQAPSTPPASTTAPAAPTQRRKSPRARGPRFYWDLCADPTREEVMARIVADAEASGRTMAGVVEPHQMRRQSARKCGV